ncbi:response regulator [Pseudoalteromonas xiamenensis]|uniref:PAS domain-containing hybrid sensor histidine kinase/response regulator n=1 Tax=Pseudoalteromonas xiamenensis TaxID=882626 RepID=UPI0035F062C8
MSFKSLSAILFVSIIIPTLWLFSALNTSPSIDLKLQNIEVELKNLNKQLGLLIETPLSDKSAWKSAQMRRIHTLQNINHNLYFLEAPTEVQTQLDEVLKFESQTALDQSENRDLLIREYLSLSNVFWPWLNQHAVSAEQAKYQPLTYSLTALAGAFALFALLLYLFYLKPLQRFLVHISKQSKEDTLIEIPDFHAKELKTIALAVKRMFFNSTQQIQHSKLLSALNEKLRSTESLETYTDLCLSYLVKHIGLPGIAILNISDNSLDVIARQGKVPFVDADNPLFKTSVTQDNYQTYSPSNQSLNIKFGSETLKIKLLYGFALKNTDNVLCLLYFPSLRILEQSEINLIKEVVKDLSVAIERDENSTLRQNTEKALAHQLELTHSMINAIPNPTFYREKSGQFIGVNKAFLDFFDQFEMDIVGSTLDQVYPPHVASMLAEKQTEILQSGHEMRYELNLQDGSGTPRDIIVFEGPFFDGNGAIQGIVGMFLDVTERNQLQQELIDAKIEADRLTKVKSEFLANMSHEIRTPMNAILGMAHLALKTQMSDKQYGYVSKINNAAKQLLSLINDILDFSKIEAGKLTLERTQFELKRVIENVSSITEIRADEKNIDFHIELDPMLPDYYIGDPLRLGQILINLAGNAVKFTDTGSVTLSVNLEKKDNEITYVRFSVKDTGIGMSQDQQKALFQSFSQADTSISRKYGGTGLGLTISQQLVRLMNGEIYVESELSKGSEFYFIVELHAVDKTAEPVLPARFTQHINALVLDDNVQALAITHELLESMGLYVSSTTDVQEASRILNESNIDIAFIDWKMRDVDGIEFIKNQRQKNRDTKYVLITAYGRDLHIEDNDKAAIDCIVLKPATPSYLYDAVVSCTGFGIAKSPEPQSLIDKSKLFEGLTILVAEDQPINQEIAVEILKHYGAKVDVANNGREAIEKVTTQTFDVVLMDMQMPEVDGLTATQEIRKVRTHESLPILAMTANAMQEDVDKCLAAGMNGHIAKPIDLQQLEQSILNCLGKSELNETTVTKSETASPTEEEQEEKQIGELVGINIKEGIDRAAGNPHIYFQILEKFLRQQSEELINLQQALSIGDTDLSSQLLHAIKGASANLSIHYLAEQCKKLEREVKDQTIRLEDIDTLISYVRSQLEVLSEMKRVDVIKPTLQPTQNSKALLDDLETALADYNTEALDLAEGLSTITAIDPDEIELVKTLITRFEFDDALQKVRNINQRLH